MTGFVLLRVRAHRLLLAAALLAVLLTCAVLAALTAFNSSVADASLRHTLRTRDAAGTPLEVTAPMTAEDRAAASEAVRRSAQRAFDGLPVRVHSLVRSGPYALPRSLRPAGERGGDPDLTRFAALEADRVRMTAGRRPGPAGHGPLEVALPENAARGLHLKPGARLTLADRLDGPRVRVRITGTYRPARPADPYWQLDESGGRGVAKGTFTTYGPLLADRSVLDGRVSAGETAWLAAADFSTLTADRIGALRTAARDGAKALEHDAELPGASASTALPGVLDRAERALLVARSTLLVVALQLVLLAGCALLLVARLLTVERTEETRLLRARGASGRRLAALAGAEALLLALPAAVCAPLLAGPLTRLLGGRGELARIGLDPVGAGSGTVWAASVAAALGCALAVALPAWSAGRERAGRARALPAPLRAGADIGLLVVAAVAYWQLRGRTSGSGTLSGDRSGTLGVDPLLVVAPALALLAGTVLTLRLLPPVVRLAERRAARGRGLAGALAGWQLSRRPGRGAGPVLLLVLAVAMGMLAIGQGASWDRSQRDQADFAVGAALRVRVPGGTELGGAGVFAALPGVRDAAPAVRASMPLSGDRLASVLALDTRHAADGMLLRRDLADGPADRAAAQADPGRAGKPWGVRLPKGATGLAFTVRAGAGSDGAASPAGSDANLTLTVEDRYGIPYRLSAGDVPVDGRRHRLAVALGGAGARPAEPLYLTGVDVDEQQPPEHSERHRLTLDGLTAVGADAAVRPGRDWRAAVSTDATTTGADSGARPTSPALGGGDGSALTVSYGTGFVPRELFRQGQVPTLTVQLLPRAGQLKEVPAVASDRFLTSAGARPGQRLDVPFGSATVRVHVVGTVRELPTTGPGVAAVGPARDEGEQADGDAAPGADPLSGDGGGLLLDLRALNRLLSQQEGRGTAPSEWWLSTAPGHSAQAAAALRAQPEIDPAQVLVRDETARLLRDDPLGAGPEAAFFAATAAGVVLAAVGFAVGCAGSLRERGHEFAVLRALGTTRRRLARTVAVEYGVLLALALAVGAALGTVLARAVVPLVVLTPRATRPVPPVLVELAPGQVALLLAAVAAAPVAITAVLALRRAAPATTLRSRGGE
ncbi:FtsX-like permease family protein [Streptomyces sp. NPDC058045]|uniref:FtsX-like permease family protein n=1 Tax=Streptomyces sp. NPDC058045 TaxID=3346311 RepID=UPI0036EC6E15